MRTHPLGVIGVGLSERETWEIAAAVSQTTHADPRCTIAVLIIVGLVRGLLRGEVSLEAHIDDIVDRAYDHVVSTPSLSSPSPSKENDAPDPPIYLSHAELIHHTTAPSFSALDLDNRRSMGYVYKCLGAGLLSLRLCMRATSTLKNPIPSQTLFEETMTSLILQGGDADTNGAVAGALLGACLGRAQLPAHWAMGLADREWLDGKVARLCARVGVLEGRADAGVDGGRGVDIGDESDEQADGGKGLMSAAELEERDRVMLIDIMERKRAREEKQRMEGKSKGFAAWFGK